MPRLDGSKLYVGIDPGASGGLVAICGRTVDAVPMPATEADVWAWINLRSEPFGREAVAIIEQVGGYIGGDGNTGSAMFKFGQSYGALRAFLIAARIPFETATPQKWQKEFGMSKRKDEKKGSWKNRLKEKAQALFPGVPITLKTADAVLIAEFCRRIHKGIGGHRATR